MSSLPPWSRPRAVLDRATREFVHQDPASPAAYRLEPGSGQEDPVLDEDATSTEWFLLPGGPTGHVRVEVVRPVGGGAGAMPVVLFLHGLGCVLGDTGTRTPSQTHVGRLVRAFALGTDAAVVLVDYTPAPEAAYPVAVEQCYAVARWLCERGGDIGLDGSRIAAVGDSAGGNLVAALTLLAKERGGIRLVQQVLLCPVTDADFGTSSYREFAEGYFVGRDTMRRFWDRYAPDVRQRGLATVSPLRATPEQLAGLPPALVVTSEADVVRDEGEAYSARLRAAGVEVVSMRYHGTIHGFMVLDRLRDTASARAALVHTLDVVHVALHTRRDQAPALPLRPASDR
ncbi:alpha/beta hydrolase [Streptomyces sp. enrichment culture]|uniref:alpha/beta hydrolase n=1 Tax=Streptomyces sp. enrichment culture TaxID=1795815 RepID=UPI003F578386